MNSRLAHRFSLALDRNVRHSGAVALSARALSAGLVCLGYFIHAWRVARRAPGQPSRGVLPSGKNAPQAGAIWISPRAGA